MSGSKWQIDERLAGDLGELGRVVEQAAQHAGAALGGLEEQEQPAQVVGRQRLGGELLLFELEDGLDPALERRLERGHLVRA